jgi:hypothetical protein
VYKIKKLEEAPKAHKGCRAIEEDDLYDEYTIDSSPSRE